MAPVQENAEQADNHSDDEESYIEEEILEDEEEILEEEVIEEIIIEDEETIEEEIVEYDEEGEMDASDDDDSSSAPPPQRPVETDKKSSHKSEARSKLLQEIAVQRKLAEDLKRRKSKPTRQNSIARRQAARDELARSNSKLKTARVARSIATNSTSSSLAEGIRRKATVEPILESAGVESINAVEIPQRQAPISPLKSREDSSRSLQSPTSRIPNLPKLKPTPKGNGQKPVISSHSRVTEWIRESPMEMESPTGKGTTRSEENVSTGVASERTERTGNRSSVSRLKKQLSLGSSQQSFGKAGSETGSVPLKSRSNDMSISSTSGGEKNNNNNNNNIEVDTYYSLAQLQANSVLGIDEARREIYLSPKDFKAHFNMTKEEFYKLPRWKQSEAKKALNLF